MKKGDYIYTPRFCTVQIEKVFKNRQNAVKEGFIEPTHYQGEYEVVGKSLNRYEMIFAAYKR